MIESHLHAALSSIPFAMFTLSMGAESYWIARRSESSAHIVTVSLVSGVSAVLAAFLSGYLAADFGHEQLGIDSDTISIHHLWGKLLLITGMAAIIARFVCRRAVFNRALFVTVFRLLLVSLWILSMITGFLGGDMLLSAGKKQIQLPVQQLNE